MRVIDQRDPIVMADTGPLIRLAARASLRTGMPLAVRLAGRALEGESEDTATLEPDQAIPSTFARTAGPILHAEHYGGRTALEAFDPLTGLVFTERSVVDKAPPIEGSPEAVATFLRELAAAGADEAILVASPINEASIRRLGDALSLHDA